MNNLEILTQKLETARKYYWEGVDELEADGITDPEKQDEILKDECAAIEKIYQEIEHLKLTKEQRRKYGI